MISPFSFLSGMLFLSLCIAIVLILSRNLEFLAFCREKILPLIIILSLIRVCFPVDIEAAHVIKSYTILPGIQSFFEIQIWGPVTIGIASTLVWILGASFFLVASLIQLFLTYKNLHTLHLITDERLLNIKAELGILDRIVLISPDIAVPISTGFFQPKIYLPAMDLTDAELRIVLRHEQQHIVNGDVWLKLFYLVLRAVLWWNPLIHVFWKKLDDILEYRCDRAVLRESCEEDCIVYTETLLHVAQQRKISKQRTQFGFTSFLSLRPQNTLMMRVTLILQGKGSSLIVVRLVTLICIAAFMGSYFVIWQSAYPAPDPIEGVDVQIDTENSYLVHTGDNQYELWLYGVHVDTYSENEINSNPLNELDIYNREE